MTKQQLKVLLLLLSLFCITIILTGCTYYVDDDGYQIETPTDNLDEKPDINIFELEAEIHDLINVERQNYGLQPLAYDNELADIARAHSQEMAIFRYFDHINLFGQDPTARAEAVGYNCKKDFGTYYQYGIGENIYQNNLYTLITTYGSSEVYSWSTQHEIARSTVDGWMSSPGHFENIVEPTYDNEGIGVAISDDFKVYITQDFF